MDIAANVELSQYGFVLLFIAGGAIFVLGGIITSKLLSPNRPNPREGQHL